MSGNRNVFVFFVRSKVSNCVDESLIVSVSAGRAYRLRRGIPRYELLQDGKNSIVP